LRRRSNPLYRRLGNLSLLLLPGKVWNWVGLDDEFVAGMVVRHVVGVIGANPLYLVVRCLEMRIGHHDNVDTLPSLHLVNRLSFLV